MKRFLLIGAGLASALSLAVPQAATRLFFSDPNTKVEVANDDGAEVQLAASNAPDLASHESLFPNGGLFTPGSVHHKLEVAVEKTPLLQDVPPPIERDAPDTVDLLPPMESAAEALEQPTVDAMGFALLNSDLLNEAPEDIESSDSDDAFPPPDMSLLPVDETAEAGQDVNAIPELTGPTDEAMGSDLDAAPGLPSLEDATPADITPEANLVLFGREMLELRVSEGWFVTEAAAGRDVRLVLTPDEYRERMNRGMWLVCHVLQGPEERDALEALLTERIATITKQQATTISTDSFSIDSWSGVRGEFELEKPAVDGSTETRRYRGFHFLIATPWAMIEGHGIAPSSDADVLLTLQEIQNSVRIHEPKEWPSQTTAATRDALPALGVWKSSLGRMRIHDSGRIDMEADKLLLLETPATHQEAERLERIGPPRLRGTYRAAGDVIHITWNDGSHLNLRWKLSRGKMLVTDHLGKISKLKPLLE